MEISEKNDLKMKVYELGYLLVPSIAEENVAAEVQVIKSVLEKNDAVTISEDFPKLRPLAYIMKKVIGGESQKFDQAYFGWVKFEATAVNATAIKNELDRSDKILRFMTINTVRESTLYTQKVAYRPTDDKAEKKDVKLSEEEIEKTIENLVVE